MIYIYLNIEIVTDRKSGEFIFALMLFFQFVSISIAPILYYAPINTIYWYNQCSFRTFIFMVFHNLLGKNPISIHLNF